MTQAVLVGAGQWQLYSSIATMSTRKQTQAKDLPRETRWWEGKLGKEEVQFQERTSCAKWVSVEDSSSSLMCTSSALSGLLETVEG